MYIYKRIISSGAIFFLARVVNEHRRCFMQFKGETIVANEGCTLFAKTRGFIEFYVVLHRIDKGFIVVILVSFTYGGCRKCARVLVRCLMEGGDTKVHGTRVPCCQSMFL